MHIRSQISFKDYFQWMTMKWMDRALFMIMFVILHVGHNCPPRQHISSALIQADCRILDVTLAWNERAKWIFLEAGDMCQFLACSLYCKKDRSRQSLWELCKWWTVPNTFDYICEAAVCCGRVTCRKDIWLAWKHAQQTSDDIWFGVQGESSQLLLRLSMFAAYILEL